MNSLAECVCGHALKDHAKGQGRSYWCCDYPDCDCQDFEAAETDAADDPNAKAS